MYNGGREASTERKRSPTPNTASGEAGGAGGAAGAAGGGRRGRKRAGRRRRNAENVQPPAPHPPGATPAPTNVNWRDEIIESKKHHAGDRSALVLLLAYSIHDLEY